MAVHLTPETLRFLRGLSKHNDRIWFEERRPVYERAVKAPFLALIAEINDRIAETAPDHVRPPHKVAMRIYRDIRFSPDKRPYKINLTAWWAREGLQKTSAAGFYLQVGAAGGLAAAGIYAPERDELLLIRRWLAEHHERYREALETLLQPSEDQPAMQLLDPNALTRNPKGFAADHPAGDLLRARNWGVMAPFTAEQALDPDFASLVAAHFSRAVNLLNALNEPFLEARSRTPSASLRL